MTALERLKCDLEKTDGTEDSKLELYLENAKDTILDYIGRDVLPDRLISAQVELAKIAYNKQGAEGEKARSEGGISRSFIEDLPADIKSRLKNYPRKVGVIYATDEE
ncbi:MAG: phage head-tail connector protein [Ruminiclostridium sp.]|nr:phage head-tail connector protein [Ruminiclostridium sp.]